MKYVARPIHPDARPMVATRLSRDALGRPSDLTESARAPPETRDYLRRVLERRTLWQPALLASSGGRSR